MNKIMFFSKHRIISIFSISIFLLSIIGQIGIHPIFAEVPGIFNLCGNMNIMAVKASGFSQIYIPKNIVDNNFTNRWSNNGLGSWIQADLGQQKVLCSVDITWHRGVERHNNFVISVSDNGKTFTDVFANKSSGTTLSPERYYFPETMGRFVRITVNGNTQNNWASINEVSVRGYSASAQPPSPSVPCQHLDISKITASHSDSSTPSNNVMDSNLSTRWSNSGNGSWIQADLGQQKVLCSVDISWYRGSTRVYNFVISISPDGTTFTDAFAGKSSGNTLSKERYDIPSVTGRFVRITVNGNTQNNWAAITEFGVNGFDIPIGTGGGGGIGGNGTGGGGGIGGNGTGGGGGIGGNGTGGGGGIGGIGFDKFGIKEIYPTKTSGEEWFMNMLSPTSDPRFEPQLSLQANPDGSYKVTSTKVRLDVFTSSGYHPENISTYDQKQLSTKGYMQSPNDWKNVEMTGYIKLNKFGDSNEHFTWYTRGGKHHDADNGCEGTAIKGDLYNDGRTRFAKEQWHSGGYVFTPLKKLTDSIVGKWVGFKTMIYSINQSNGQIATKMENWVDQNNTGIWKKIDEFVDNGRFGSEGGHCGGASDQIISWGGPVATFRWDSASDVDVKNLSVREIQAP